MFRNCQVFAETFNFIRLKNKMCHIIILMVMHAITLSISNIDRQSPSTFHNLMDPSLDALRKPVLVADKKRIGP